MNVAKWLLLALLALPLMELAVFIAVAASIGFVWTLSLVLAGSLAGALILRHAGGSHIARIRVALGDGGMTAVQADSSGFLILLAGILLLIPGFITDIAGLLLLMVSVGLVAAQAQQPAAARAKVVLQMSDGDAAKWNLALNNAKNLQTDLGAANVDIEVVAYGPGIGMLKADSVVGNRVDEALSAGVKVLACENTMRGQKLGKSDMLKGIDYVPAGVVEIMQRQQQGWAYIRP